MPEEIRDDYEVSSESAVRHWEVPYDKLEDITPTATMPAALLSRIDGTQLTGTILTVDSDDDIAVIDFTHSMVYLHEVRNVITYYDSAEYTFDTIDVGDPIFYDRSATLPAGCQLSLSPLDVSGNANPLFGFRVLPQDWTDDDDKGSAQAAGTYEVAVMQIVGD